MGPTSEELRDGVAKSGAWMSYSDMGAWTYC
jgi:hypothetical protein